MGVGFLATMLDQEMLEVEHLVQIFPSFTPNLAMPAKTGLEVSQELGNRYLLRYLLRDQVGRFTAGSTDPHYVTPTTYSPKELTGFLALPNPRKRRAYVLVLDPKRIAEIRGPRWVRAGNGIEYILPNGFGPDAVAFKDIGPTWEIEVR
jgi:hypothetical protein